MRSSKPPALAVWLLEHSGFASRDGAVAGDLLEEYQRGRSGGWYWRQVLAALMVGWTGEVRRHKTLAVRAVLFTWAANYAVTVLGRRLLAQLAPSAGAGGTIQMALWGICFLGSVVTGVAVGLLYRTARNAMLMTSTGALLGWSLLAVTFLKHGALQHSVWQIAGAALVYYLVVLVGFLIGGFLLTPGVPPDQASSTT